MMAKMKKIVWFVYWDPNIEAHEKNGCIKIGNRSAALRNWLKLHFTRLIIKYFKSKFELIEKMVLRKKECSDILY